MILLMDTVAVGGLVPQLADAIAIKPAVAVVVSQLYRYRRFAMYTYESFYSLK
jgi:hypothetical protein